MNSETYLNHPTFGLLFKVCTVEENQELFTTLYAQRLFFFVKFGSDGLTFEPITRSDARILVETRLRKLRRLPESSEEYEQLRTMYQSMGL